MLFWARGLWKRTNHRSTVKPPLLGRQNKNHGLILVKINHANHQGSIRMGDNKYSLALGKPGKALRGCADLDLAGELSALCFLLFSPSTLIFSGVCTSSLWLSCFYGFLDLDLLCFILDSTSTRFLSRGFATAREASMCALLLLEGVPSEVHRSGPICLLRLVSSTPTQLLKPCLC